MMKDYTFNILVKNPNSVFQRELHQIWSCLYIYSNSQINHKIVHIQL